MLLTTVAFKFMSEQKILIDSLHTLEAIWN